MPKFTPLRRLDFPLPSNDFIKNTILSNNKTFDQILLASGEWVIECENKPIDIDGLKWIEVKDE
jgi:hypothetical protein